MPGHLVALTAFLMKPEPQALAMLEKISDPHRHRRTHPGETVDHDPPMSARSRSPINVVMSIESSSLRASSAESTGVLPRLTTYLGPRTELAGLRSEERRVGKEWRSRWSPYH